MIYAVCFHSSETFISYPSKASFLLHVTIFFAKLTTMSSPHKQFKLQSHQGRRLNEPLLPLHLALAWIIIRVFPINSDLQSLLVYSSQFTQKVLHIVAREILDVSVRSKISSSNSVFDWQFHRLEASQQLSDLLRRNSTVSSRPKPFK